MVVSFKNIHFSQFYFYYSTAIKKWPGIFRRLKKQIFSMIFIRDQTLLDEENVALPAIDNFVVNEPLGSLVITTEEVKAILRSFNASGW